MSKYYLQLTTRVQPSPQPTDRWVNQFAETAAWACVFELKARMLAQMVPTLKKRSLSAKLDKLNKLLIDHFASQLTPSDLDLLKALPGLRNNLLHLDLTSTRDRIRPFADQLEQTGLITLDLNTGAGGLVSNMSTTEGTIFGWLFESFGSGSFREGAKLFARGVHVIERLMDSPSTPLAADSA
jgi:hypothetical protein